MQAIIKENHSEPIYIKAARSIVDAEYRAQIANKKYFIKQKLSGLILAIMSIIIPIILDGDITGSIVILPLGIWLLSTKDKVFYTEVIL